MSYLSDDFLDAIAWGLIALFDTWSEHVEQLDWTVDDAISLVRVRNPNGCIVVRGASQDVVTVKVLKTVRAPAEESAPALAQRVRVLLDQVGDILYLRAVYPSLPLGGSVFVRYEITVPRTVDLDLYTQRGGIIVDGIESGVEAETRSGNITLAETLGPATLYTSRGQIRVTDVDGAVEAESGDGDILAQAFTGEASFRTTRGRISIEGNDGMVRARSYDSDIELTNGRGGAHLQSVNGDIRASFENLKKPGDFMTQHGSIALDIRDGRASLEAETLEGDVHLALAPDFSGWIDAGTGGGVVQNELDLAIEQQSGNWLVGRMGSGDEVVVKLRAFNGDIVLEKPEARQ